jgi:serine/threonine protein phosphatase PrpC
MWRFFVPRSTDRVGVLFAMATFASLRVQGQPMVTSLEQKRKDCSPQGCVLLPRDIFYDKSSQEALEQLRDESKEKINQNTDAANASTKALVELLMSGDEDMATLTLIGYKGGDPNTQINQDRAFAISPYYVQENDPVVLDTTSDLDTQRLMGVFDGHATFGERVSEYSVQQFPQVLADHLNTYLVSGLTLEERDAKIKQSLEESFVLIDKTAPACPSGGCTATVILQLGPKLYVANAGDSSSFVVVHRASTNKTSIVYMSREDKPELPDEKERIERMGGRVYMQAGATSRAIYYDTSTGGQSGLAMSRSLGDWDAGKVGVIPNPIVDIVDLNEIIQQARWSKDDDDVYIFAVSASDGMMDFVDPATIARVLVPALFETDGDHPLTACERLISMAAAGWQQAKEGRYRDDIAISVQTIRAPPNKRTFKDDEL